MGRSLPQLVSDRFAAAISVPPLTGHGRSATDSRPDSCRSARNPNAVYILAAFIGADRKAVTAHELVRSMAHWKAFILRRSHFVRVSEPRQRRIPDHPKWRSTRTRPRSLPPVLARRQSP